MDEDDFRAILEVLQENLRDIGASEIADPRGYLVRDTDDGELRSPPPDELAIEMLEALDRFLAVRDRSTYDTALLTLSHRVDRRIEEVIVVDPEDELASASLSDLPDLSDLRGDLSKLIGQLRENRIGPRFR